MKAVTKRETQYLEAFSQCRTINGAAKICGVCAPVATRALRHIAKKLGKSKPSELLEQRYGEDSLTESQKEKLRMFRKYRSVGATAIAMRLSHGAILSSLRRIADRIGVENIACLIGGNGFIPRRYSDKASESNPWIKRCKNEARKTTKARDEWLARCDNAIQCLRNRLDPSGVKYEERCNSYVDWNDAAKKEQRLLKGKQICPWIKRAVTVAGCQRRRRALRKGKRNTLTHTEKSILFVQLRLF